jgi:hypothetical protein
MKERFYKRKMDTREELLACTSGAAACIKNREDQLTRSTLDLRARVAMFTEVGGGILGTFIVICYRFVI